MSETHPDIDSLWSYEDPNATRERFLAVLHKLPQEPSDAYRLVLLTQIARTFSLQADFEKCHALLDDVERSAHGDPLVRTRYLLERGRAFRSSGRIQESLPLFLDAFMVASGANLDNFAVDAAHMVALAESAPQAKREWNLKALEMASASKDPKARKWLGSLLNNLGWDYFGEKNFDGALEMFEKALAFRESQGDWKSVAVAKWSVARVLRAKGRLDEALALQLALKAEHEKNSHSDGFVFEELGELHLAKEDPRAARPFFAEAFRELSKDVWLPRNEPQRLDRLKRLGAMDN